MELPRSGHDLLLMNEVLEALGPGEGKTIVDCTLGRGGDAVEVAGGLGESGGVVGVGGGPRDLEVCGGGLKGGPGGTPLNCGVRGVHANFAGVGGGVLGL